MNRKPLSELNIKDFIGPVASCSKKRPLNPNIVLSPSKRRVLESEGVPYVAHKPRSLLASLVGCQSPARKLDFGSPKSAERPTHSLTLPKQTPRAMTTVTTTITTTTTTTKITAITPTRATAPLLMPGDLDNPFATPRPAKSALAPSPDITPQPAKRTKRDSVFEDITTRNASLFLSPREEPSRYYYIDQHSEDYPGFDIYYDPDPKEAPRLDEEEEERDEIQSKENSHPPRKSKKAVSLPMVGPPVEKRNEVSRSRSIPVAKR